MCNFDIMGHEFLVREIVVYPFMRRSRLASLFEGGGSPKGETEGVLRHFRELPQSKIKLIFDSPLSEGAEAAQHPLHR